MLAWLGRPASRPAGRQPFKAGQCSKSGRNIVMHVTTPIHQCGTPRRSKGNCNEKSEWRVVYYIKYSGAVQHVMSLQLVSHAAEIILLLMHEQ